MIYGADPVAAFHLLEGEEAGRRGGRKARRLERATARQHGDGPDQPWLRVSEVAGALGVAEVTVRRWIKSGRLTAQWAGDQYRVHRNAVTASMRPAGPQLGARKAGRQQGSKRRIEESGKRRIGG